MSLITLYINNATGKFVQGPQNQAEATNPVLNCPDNPQVKIYLLDPVPTVNIGTAFTSTPTVGLTLACYLDDGILNTTNIYATLTGITTGNDVNGNYFLGTLNLNTVPLETLIGSNPQGADVYLQIGYTTLAGNQTTVYSNKQHIGIGIPSGAVATVPAGQTPLSLEVARNLFFPQFPPPGLPLQLVSAGGHTIQRFAKDNPDGTTSPYESQLN